MLPFRVIDSEVSGDSGDSEDAIGIGGALEIAAEEWGVSPVRIMEEWTEEFFWLLMIKRIQRLRRIQEEREEGSDLPSLSGKSNGDRKKVKKVSDKEFFEVSGIKPQYRGL